MNLHYGTKKMKKLLLLLLLAAISCDNPSPTSAIAPTPIIITIKNKMNTIAIWQMSPTNEHLAVVERDSTKIILCFEGSLRARGRIKPGYYGSVVFPVVKNKTYTISYDGDDTTLTVSY